MIYTEVIINTSSDVIETRCARLEEMGVAGFVIEDENDFRDFLNENHKYWDYVDESLEKKYKGISRIKIYFEPNDPAINSVLDEFPNAQVNTVNSDDWENNWKENYKPIEIGENMVVVPRWEEIPQNNRIPLILDSGLIFGTGSHPTTKMCLEVLQTIEMKDKTVLDLGCGSGILGIAAMLLGAKECTAIDIDDNAPKIVKENAQLNNVNITAFSKDVLGNKWAGYDIVIANIVADVIIKLAKNVNTNLFICSGIIDNRCNEVIEALKEANFKILKHVHEDEWNCFVCGS